MPAFCLEEGPAPALRGHRTGRLYLTEELVRLGHDVTLFASGDSVTSARLVPACPRSLRLHAGCIDQLAHHVLMLEQVYQEAATFDVIHFHIDYLHYRSRAGASFPSSPPCTAGSISPT